MDLILWRHADALDPAPGQDDLSRALSAKGQAQAQRVGQWLHRHLPANALILASPAKRTQQTAAALGRSFDTDPALAPDTTVDAVLRSVRWPDGDACIVVVGHQPTLGADCCAPVVAPAPAMEHGKSRRVVAARRPPRRRGRRAAAHRGVARPGAGLMAGR